MAIDIISRTATPAPRIVGEGHSFTVESFTDLRHPGLEAPFRVTCTVEDRVFRLLRNQQEPQLLFSVPLEGARGYAGSSRWFRESADGQLEYLYSEKLRDWTAGDDF
jgi:hypothetical protein